MFSFRKKKKVVIFTLCMLCTLIH